MRLESALNSSREGLTSHGIALATVGDNIANISTTGFKASRAEFSDLMSEGTDGKQSLAIASSGAGVKVSKVRQIHDLGVIEFTGRALDVAIAGEGFFMVGSAENPAYTRAGNFQVNGSGVLTDSDGNPVLGTPATTTTTGGETSTALTSLNLLDVNVSGSATTESTIAGNLESISEIATPPAAPTRFQDIAETANFTTGLTVYDSQGGEHNVTVGFYKTAANTWTALSYMDGGEVGGTAGVPVQVGQTATLNFSSSGVIEDANAAAASIAVTAPYSGGAAAGSFTIDLSGFTQYAALTGLSGVTQNGKGVGEVTGYEFKKDGRIVALLSSGSEALVGTVQLVSFVNKDGLKRAGNNLFIEDTGAGRKDPGQPGTEGLGELEGSSLERSTVDISTAFVDLVVYQRGYQANSQVMSIASSTLRDTLGLLR